MNREESKLPFRVEAIAASSNTLHGEILIRFGTHYFAFGATAALLAIALIAFTVAFDYQKHTLAPGTLHPESGTARVVAPAGAVLVSSNVREGQPVSAGDVLFTLKEARAISDRSYSGAAETDLLRSRQTSLQEDLPASNMELAAKLKTFAERRALLTSEHQRIQRQIVLQRSRVELSAANVARAQTLLQQGFFSEALLENRQADHLDQQQRLVELEKVELERERDISTLAGERDAQLADARKQEGSRRREMAQIGESIFQASLKNEYQLRAPVSGIVTALTFDVGQNVDANQQLAKIIPASGKLEAEVMLPAEAVGFVKPGDVVMLRYTAYPYQKFGQHSATVERVSLAATNNPFQAKTSFATDQPKADVRFRAVARLSSQSVNAYGGSFPLLADMPVEVVIPLERRKIFMLLIDPVRRWFPNV